MQERENERHKQHGVCHSHALDSGSQAFGPRPGECLGPEGALLGACVARLAVPLARPLALSVRVAVRGMGF